MEPFEFKAGHCVKTCCYVAERVKPGERPEIHEGWNIGYVVEITGFQQALCKMIAPDKTSFEKIYRFQELIKINETLNNIPL